MLIISLFIVTLFLLAAVLFLLGLRGKRIDSHPVCRRCHYDLSGFEEKPLRCSECGSSLDTRRAVRVGNRKKSKVAIAAALLIFLTAGVLFGTLWWSQVTQFDWFPYKPFFLLRGDVDSTDATEAKQTQDEIMRRLNAGDLSDSQINSFNEEILEIQSDFNRTWLTFYGDFLEAAYDKGRVTDAQFSRYARAACEHAFSLEVRDQVYRDFETLVSLNVSVTRAGTQSNFAVMFDDGEMQFNNQPLPRSHPFQGMRRLGVRTQLIGRDIIPFDEEPGRYRLSFNTICSVIANPQDEPMPSDFAPVGDEFSAEAAAKHRQALDDWRKELEEQLMTNPTAEFPIHLKRDIEIVEDDVEIVKMLSDEIDEAALKAAFKVDSLTLQFGVHAPDFRFRLNGQPTGIDLSFDVYLRVDGREFLVDRATSDTTVLRQANIFWLSSILDEDERTALYKELRHVPRDATTADLIFRTNPRWAVWSAHITEVWDGEIILEDIPIIRP